MAWKDILVGGMGQVIGVIFTAENIAKYADEIFDLFERIVTDTENTLDDKLVLPFISAMWAAFGIPKDED